MDDFSLRTAHETDLYAAAVAECFSEVLEYWASPETRKFASSLRDLMWSLVKIEIEEVRKLLMRAEEMEEAEEDDSKWRAYYVSAALGIHYQGLVLRREAMLLPDSSMISDKVLFEVRNLEYSVEQLVGNLDYIDGYPGDVGPLQDGWRSARRSLLQQISILDRTEVDVSPRQRLAQSIREFSELLIIQLPRVAQKMQWPERYGELPPWPPHD